MMGLSANRNGAQGAPKPMPASVMPAYGQPAVPKLVQGFLDHGAHLRSDVQMPWDHSQLSLTAQTPQVQPGQYTHLQNFAHSQNPFVAILGRSLMQGMENRRNAAGMSPEDWQAQIDARRAARRGF